MHQTTEYACRAELLFGEVLKILTTIIPPFFSSEFPIILDCPGVCPWCQVGFLVWHEWKEIRYKSVGTATGLRIINFATQAVQLVFSFCEHQCKAFIHNSCDWWMSIVKVLISKMSVIKWSQWWYIWHQNFKILSLRRWHFCQVYWDDIPNVLPPDSWYNALQCDHLLDQ